MTKLAVMVTSESLGDVPSGRPDAPPHVVAKTAVLRRSLSRKNCIYSRSQFVGQLPALKFREMSYSQGGQAGMGHAGSRDWSRRTQHSAPGTVHPHPAPSTRHRAPAPCTLYRAPSTGVVLYSCELFKRGPARLQRGGMFLHDSRPPSSDFRLHCSIPADATPEAGSLKPEADRRGVSCRS